MEPDTNRNKGSTDHRDNQAQYQNLLQNTTNLRPGPLETIRQGKRGTAFGKKNKTIEESKRSQIPKL